MFAQLFLKCTELLQFGRCAQPKERDNAQRGPRPPQFERRGFGMCRNADEQAPGVRAARVEPVTAQIRPNFMAMRANSMSFRTPSLILIW